MYETHDLELILDANIPIVVVETPDERRILDLLTRFAIKRTLPCFLWTCTQGLRRLTFAEAPAKDALLEPQALLKHVLNQPGPGIYVLCDFHPYLQDSPRVTRFLKDVALEYETLKNTLVMVSHAFTVPPEISRLAAAFDVALPSDAELMAIVREVAAEWAKRHPQRKVRTDERTLNRFIANLRGLTHSDARVLVRHAISRDGAITESDLPQTNKLKFQLLDAEGLLRFEHDTESFRSIAGLDNLKAWLNERHQAFLDPAPVDRPKGILLLGVQGSGKSLAARAVSGQWGLPLLRLDFGTLYNKYIGETERNLRNSLQQAEVMAPCILWIDEIEKGVSTDESDNATSMRVLATLLNWMAERKSSVFIVATANDVSRMPPELIRKGRLDEIFFVDLPDKAARQAILIVHLNKRGYDTNQFDVEELADVSEGFTGAELEQAIVAARYRAAARSEPISQALLAKAITEAVPLSVTMEEKMSALRTWADGRTVRA